MSMAQFWFNFNNAWSGQKYYTEGSIQFYNLMYTSLPILLLGKYYFHSMVVCKYVYVCVLVCFCRCVLLVALKAVILYASYNAITRFVTYCPTQDNTERSRCHPTYSRSSPYPPSTDTFPQPHLHFLSSLLRLVSTSSIPHVSHSSTSSLTSSLTLHLPLLYIFSALLGAYDMDIPASAIFRYPRLYMAGIKNEYFKV
jgi:Phospholipid-translocating P-type ATPase C-terminal